MFPPKYFDIIFSNVTVFLSSVSLRRIDSVLSPCSSFRKLGFSISYPIDFDSLDYYTRIVSGFICLEKLLRRFLLSFLGFNFLLGFCPRSISRAAIICCSVLLLFLSKGSKNLHLSFLKNYLNSKSASSAMLVSNSLISFCSFSSLGSSECC